MGPISFEMARRLRGFEAISETPPIPIVAITANVLKGEEERCLEAGMNDFLTKPVPLNILSQTLKTWLDPQDGDEISEGT